MCDEQCRNEGKGDWFERIVWPRIKVRRALKRRNHAFSLHEYEEFEWMVKRGEAVGRELFKDVRV